MNKDNQKRLNEVINYIEKNITENIDYKELSKILLVNEYTLHRIFSFITNISIPEYIRKRRMSLAAQDLLNSNLKVIDVAVKYQYDSATSFSRAFKNFMGFNPNELKENEKFVKFFPILKFNNLFEEPFNFEYQEINNLSITFYALKKKMKIREIPTLSPIFWKEVMNKYPNISDSFEYGLVEYDNINANDENNSIYYVANKTPFNNCEEIQIINKSYLKFKLPTNNIADINNFTKKIYSSIIFELGYNIDNSPDIEEYIDNNIYIYVAVKK